MLADPRPIAGGDGTLSKDKIDKIVDAHGAGIRKALEDGGVSGRSANRPPIYPPSGRVPGKQHDSIGEAFIDSDAYRGWVERFPSGGPSGPGEYRSDPVDIPAARHRTPDRWHTRGQVSRQGWLRRAQNKWNSNR